MKKILTFLILLVFTTGCAAKEQTADGSATAAGDGKTPVASWESFGSELQYAPKLLGNTLYYMEGDWDAESGWHSAASIYRKQGGTSDTEKIADMGNEELILYLVDESEDLYCLYASDNGEKLAYFIRKTDREGTVIYDMPVSGFKEAGAQKTQEPQEVLQRIGTVTMGEVSVNGELCLADAYGDLYLFDTEGQIQCIGGAGWNSATYHGGHCGLVNAGSEGILSYRIENDQVLLQKINIPDGTLGTPITVQMGDSHSASQGISGEIAAQTEETLPGSLEIYNGYDRGIFLSDSDTLWRYDVSGGESVKVLSWGDKNVNLKGYMIDAIGLLPDESLYVMAHQTYEDVAFLHIAYQDMTEIPEKQTVTLAVVSNYEIMNSGVEELTSAFNRRMTGYQVEVRPYASVSDLQLQLIRGKGPDLFCLEGLDVGILANKNILADLTPFFEESDKVKAADLLPSIQKAGTRNGKLLCVFPTFQINGFWVEKGTTEKGGWTPEQFITLGQKVPGASLLDYNPEYYYNYILLTATRADLAGYINWEDKKCYFNNDNFVTLLEKIKTLKVPNQKKTDILAYDPVADWTRFYQKELLTYPFCAISIDSFDKAQYKKALADGNFAEIAGYPNQDGAPCFDLLPIMAFGINSASETKAGAWAFLEFLLSEEYQSTLTSFPVRQDAFDSYVAAEYLRDRKVNLSSEDRTFLRYMTDNACWMQSAGTNAILVILSEETAPFWDGAKSAAEAAEIIQNRVTLYLNE